MPTKFQMFATPGSAPNNLEALPQGEIKTDEEGVLRLGDFHEGESVQGERIERAGRDAIIIFTGVVSKVNKEGRAEKIRITQPFGHIAPSEEVTLHGHDYYRITSVD